MTKEKELIISGKTIPVNMGCGFFYEYFLQATNIDLISVGIVTTDISSAKAWLYLKGFIYAGNRAYCEVRDQKCELTVEDAKKIAYSLDETQSGKLLLECFAIMAGKSVDDLEKNVKAQVKKKH